MELNHPTRKYCQLYTKLRMAHLNAKQAQATLDELTHLLDDLDNDFYETFLAPEEDETPQKEEPPTTP